MNTFLNYKSGFLAIAAYWAAIIVILTLALYLIKKIPQIYRGMNLQTTIIVSWIILFILMALCWRFELPWFIILFVLALRSKIPKSNDPKLKSTKRFFFNTFWIILILSCLISFTKLHQVAYGLSILAWICLAAVFIYSDYRIYRENQEA